MKKAKAKVHSSPTEYRIIWKGVNSIGENVQHYSVFHSSEALDFLAHTFRGGHIHAEKIKVIAVEEWCRFRRIWIDRMEPAVTYAESPELGDLILVDAVFETEKQEDDG